MNQAQMMQQVKKMQQQMAKVQDELANMVIQGSAGGGAVTIEMNGEYRCTKVTLNKEAVDPEDVETLEDLLVIAINDVVGQVQEISSTKMGALTGGMKIPGLF